MPKKKSTKKEPKGPKVPKAQVGRPRKKLGTRVSDLPLVTTLKPTTRRINIDSLAMNRARLAYKRDYGKVLDERQSRALIDAMSTTKRGPIGSDVVGTIKGKEVKLGDSVEASGFFDYYKKALKAIKKDPTKKAVLKVKSDGTLYAEIPGIPMTTTSSLGSTSVPDPTAASIASTAELRSTAEKLLAKNAKIDSLIASGSLSPGALAAALAKKEEYKKSLSSVAQGIEGVDVSPMDERDELTQERARQRTRATDGTLTQEERNLAADRVRQITRQLVNFDRSRPVPTRTINADEAEFTRAALRTQRPQRPTTEEAPGVPVTAATIAETRAALRAAPELVAAIQDEAPAITRPNLRPVSRPEGSEGTEGAEVLRPRRQRRNQGPVGPLSAEAIQERQRMLRTREEADRLANERQARIRPIVESEAMLRPEPGRVERVVPTMEALEADRAIYNQIMGLPYEPSQTLEAARNALYQRDLAERTRRQRRRNVPQSVVLDPTPATLDEMRESVMQTQLEARARRVPMMSETELELARAYEHYLQEHARAQENERIRQTQIAQQQAEIDRLARLREIEQAAPLDDFISAAAPSTAPVVSRINIEEQKRLENQRRAENIVAQMKREEEAALEGVRIPFGNPIRSNQTQRYEPVSDINIEDVYAAQPYEYQPRSEREERLASMVRRDTYNELLKKLRSERPILPVPGIVQGIPVPVQGLPVPGIVQGQDIVPAALRRRAIPPVPVPVQGLPVPGIVQGQDIVPEALRRRAIPPAPAPAIEQSATEATVPYTPFTSTRAIQDPSDLFRHQIAGLRYNEQEPDLLMPQSREPAFASRPIPPPIAFSSAELEKAVKKRNAATKAAETRIVTEMEKKKEAAKGTQPIIEAFKLQEQRARLKKVTKAATDVVQDIINAAAANAVDPAIAKQISDRMAIINKAQRGEDDSDVDDETSTAFVNQPISSASSGPSYEAAQYLSLPEAQQQAALEAMTEDQKLQLGIGLSMIGKGLSGRGLIGGTYDSRTDWRVLMDSMKTMRKGSGKRMRGAGSIGGAMGGSNGYTLQAVTFPDTDWKSSSSLRWLRSNGIKPMKKADRQGSLFRYRIVDPKKFTDYYTSQLVSRGRTINLVYGK